MQLNRTASYLRGRPGTARPAGRGRRWHGRGHAAVRDRPGAAAHGPGPRCPGPADRRSRRSCPRPRATRGPHRRAARHRRGVPGPRRRPPPGARLLPQLRPAPGRRPVAGGRVPPPVPRTGRAAVRGGSADLGLLPGAVAGGRVAGRGHQHRAHPQLPAWRAVRPQGAGRAQGRRPGRRASADHRRPAGLRHFAGHHGQGDSRGRRSGRAHRLPALAVHRHRRTARAAVPLAGRGAATQ